MPVILIEVKPSQNKFPREWQVDGKPGLRVYWNPIIRDLMVSDEVFDAMTHDEVAAVDALRHQLRNGAIMAKLLWSQEGNDVKWIKGVTDDCPVCRDARNDGLDDSK